MIPTQPWLEHLVVHVALARVGRDPEGVHQLRVASRRLGAWLHLGDWDVLQSDLRWLRRIAGAVRDLDVLLSERHGDPLDTWLARRRERAQAMLVETLDSPRTVGLQSAFETLPPLADASARANLERLGARVHRRGRRAEDSRGDSDEVEAWHDLRRALRQLRYAREWFELPTKPLRALQDELGELGDLALLWRQLREFPEPHAIRNVLDHSKERLAGALERARAAWKMHRDDVSAES